ncbi:(2Fe-2S)-binding protein [Natribacillus halophilus]|uniref:BFD-like [2Fe-2S] binding domain-containing protein n=1 Tax=Natribacillus halophilus TaxID=549003 RepID=A0A1G8R8P0_9BACI|nr:(2Fe-2S)-binding protein [Natribacillus halophilus]SDJ13309.1 BFD-like [2Fe-2S] binding domain-containing protein [Natribacillus halophilus]
MSTLIVCRCEEVSLETLQKTAYQYHCSSRELKLRTRAGMGVCGGRSCRMMIEQIATAGDNEKNYETETIPLKYQPPIRPVPFGVWGGLSDE